MCRSRAVRVSRVVEVCHDGWDYRLERMATSIMVADFLLLYLEIYVLGMKGGVKSVHSDFWL